MSKTRTLLLSALLPVSLMANHAIKLQPSNWQLIGITGYYEVAGAGSAGTTPDLSNPQGIVDFVDPNNFITWDTLNAVGVKNTTGTTTTNFEVGSAPTIVNDPNAGNVELGLPYHAVVGLRSMGIANSSLAKAAISYNPLTKDYGAPMRTMYIVSPLSAGEPDVMVVYAANMENQPFKISFKNSTGAVWDFGAEPADKVYTAVFSRENTYDNALSKDSGLAEILPTSGSAGETSGYKALTNTFDMNISTNVDEQFAELNTSNFQALDGNATIYKYNTKQGLWAVTSIEGKGGLGIEDITALGEKGNTGATNTNYNNIKGDFTSWDKGYGYWVKVDRDAAYTNEPTGILANNQIRSASDYDDKLSAGWNLLSFPDGTLRYATSGVVIPNAVADLEIVSPFGDANVAMATANQAGCNTFNQAVVTRNATLTNTNKLDVRCLWNGTDSVLISDKPFFVQGDLAGNPQGIESLTGYAFTADDMADINGSIGENYAIKTKMGEYALLLETNPDFDDAALGLTNTLAMGLPSWFNINPITADGTDTVGNLSTAFSGLISGAPKPSYDTASRGVVHGIDSNSSTTNSLLLFAANQRFYVRDNTFVRVFDTLDNNGSVLAISRNGSDPETAPIDWMLADGTKNCNAINTAVNAVDTTVKTICVSVPADSNNSVAFFSDSSVNFDIKETNTAAELLMDRHIGGADLNGSVYGAIKAVYQASDVAKKLAFSTADGATTWSGASVSNLTYSAVWAEDFPNNGALYYMATQGYKPEMFISAVTSDGTIAANAQGTISWKALDTTRNPAEWFDSSNDFELFWTEKERGYWVYLTDGYTNPVTVNNVQTTSSSTVTKHFNNIIVGGEGDVFNWFDGYLDARVGGLVRTGYTNGQSYIVNASVGGGKMTMATTGAVSSGAATFTTYLSDFEVDGFRPTGLIEAQVSASDGLGGRASNQAVVNYAKPATPTVEFEGNTLVATSSDVATDVVLYDGNITDLNPEHLYTGAIATAVDLSTLSTIEYPATQTAPVTDSLPSFGSALGTIVKDLRVIAATAPATNKLSVYSNMRSVNYLPIYSATAHMSANGENNATEPDALYSVTVGVLGDKFGVAYRGANEVDSTLVFKPLVKNDITGGSPIHANVIFDDATAQIQWLDSYDGEVFYIRNNNTGKWYYGIFPDSSAWNTPYDLTLVEATGIEQEL